jgi:hypothetical protein
MTRRRIPEMEKLAAVEEAKALMQDAKDWPIWKWLTEKPRVRATADRGTAALDEHDRAVKQTWSDDLRNAYAELEVESAGDDDPFAAAEYEYVKQLAQNIGERTRLAARRVKEADDLAYEARMLAEETFAQAERRVSASLARKGAEQAIRAYDLRYKAIAESEAAQRESAGT